MKNLLFILLSSCSFIVYSQVDLLSKEYQNLKITGSLAGQTITSTSLPSTPIVHYKGNGTKTGVCDCLVQLDSTFILAMAPNDDLYSNNISLPFNFNFYGATYDSLYINNNGNISFTMPYNTFTANPFPDPSFNMIAPFWADVDTRSTNGGNVWYKLNPHSMVIVWDHVGYFSMMEDKLNTFQLIISDGQDTIVPAGNNVSFCYGDMQWTTGAASSGVNGFGGSPATVGVNIGNGLDYFQVGQFDTLGTSFDGPYNTVDQVDFLDNQEIYFNLAGSTTNIPPLLISSLICDTIDVYTGDTLHKSMNAVDFTLGVSTPEINQILSTSIQCSLPSALTYVETPIGSEFIRYDLTFDATNVQPGYYSITVEVTDNGIPAQTVLKTIPVHVMYDANLSGLNDLNPTLFNVYPNPFQAELHVEGLAVNDEIQVIDLQGKLVHIETAKANIISLSSLQKGFYFLRISRNGALLETVKIQKD